MRPDGLTVTAGGAPSAQQLAALGAAVATVLEQERTAPADPTPAAYRSRWRRAALMETTEVPVNLKDLGPAWGSW